MKMKKLITSMALVVVGAALFHTAANAQAVGDLILGFEQTGSASNLEVDLGSINLFNTLAAGTTINLTAGTVTAGYGDLDPADITATYGSSPANLSFGVVGTVGASTKEIFVTDGAGTPNLVASNNSAESVISTLETSQGNGTPGALDSTDDVLSTSASGSWNKEGGSSFKFGTAFDVQTLYSNSGTVDLNLYDMPQGSGSATELGTFELSSSQLTFVTPPEAVPEPKTYVLISLASVVMVVMMRRRMIQS
jgi:hypothetical protein